VKILRYVPLVLCVALGAAAPASAQIYSWRAGNGNPVYSDHPPGTEAPSFRVIGTPFRSTRPADARFAASYDRLIEKHAATYAVPPHLVRAVVQVESGFNTRAVSSKGAMGLMQLMPSTAIEMGVRDPFDPDENIRGGVAYLRQLLNRYAGDQKLALAAYNAGPEAVDRYGYRVPPFRETQNYVSRVRGRSGDSYQSPGAGDGQLVTRYSNVATPVVVGKRAVTAGKVAGKRAAAAPRPAPPPRIYKSLEKTVDGRLVPKFSDTRPASGSYEIVQ
jgi:hypothetical protein